MKQTITKIVKVGTAKRYELFLNGEPSLTVHEEVLIKYGLYKGMEIEQEKWQELLAAEEKSKVRQAAFRYLSYRPRTRKEMELFLMGKEFLPIYIESVLAELEAKGYLDDASYAKAWVQERKRKNLGNFRIMRELKQKGVSEEYISQALSETDQEEERQLAMQIAERRYLRIQHEPWQKIERKLGNFLLRRGFSWEIIEMTLRTFRDRRRGD